MLFIVVSSNNYNIFKQTTRHWISLVWQYEFYARKTAFNAHLNRKKIVNNYKKKCLVSKKKSSKKKRSIEKVFIQHSYVHDLSKP